MAAGVPIKAPVAGIAMGLITSKDEKEWIYNQEGYTVVSKDFKYKSRVIKRKVKVKDELKDITEKVVVYFSKKF